MNAESELDLESLAVHEAGHWVVATEGFGIPATMLIEVRDDESLAGGLCIREFPGSKFEAACVGWAGIVAEHLTDHVARSRTSLLYPLKEATLEKWSWEALYFLPELSDPDREHIVAYPFPVESLRHTFRILTKNKARLLEAAALLADRTRKRIAERRAKVAAADEAKWFGIPRPESFPAPFESFLSLVVTGDTDSAIAMFTEFCKDDARTWLRWKKNPLKLDDSDDFRTAVRAQLATDLARWERGFNTPDEWRNLAVAFLKWKKRAPVPAPAPTAQPS